MHRTRTLGKFQASLQFSPCRIYQAKQPSKHWIPQDIISFYRHCVPASTARAYSSAVFPDKATTLTISLTTYKHAYRVVLLVLYTEKKEQNVGGWHCTAILYRYTRSKCQVFNGGVHPVVPSSLPTRLPHLYRSCWSCRVGCETVVYLTCPTTRDCARGNNACRV